ncbi:hypothetical protein ACFFR3_37535 [Nonomuraea salmonea]|uniref:Potassium/proton antiporter subunit KhtT-like N-terminal domain-containing protein n=1 Tax=Nonomuraea salmonea TaxID=46181 RepID=A0ABV5NY91_9ACTN
MNITHTPVPGGGVIHHFDTHRGDHLAVIISPTGQRSLIVYDRQVPDTPIATVEFDQQEADQVAGLLHSRPLAERLAAVEQRLESLLQDVRD